MKWAENVSKPKLFAPSTMRFWDDPYIAKNMLEAHLNDSHDAASRATSTRKKHVTFITTLFPSAKYNQLLDLGCGPGLYTDAFQKKGYKVTGYDMSASSIAYAKSQNKKVHYQVKDYLSLDEEASYDIITLIYCDFGVLSFEDREGLLKRIFRALKPGGVFLFDGFTAHYAKRMKETQTWTYEPQDGFFKKDPHLCLKGVYHYPNYVFLEQYTLIDERKFDTIRVWNQGFTVDYISASLRSHGFRVEKIYQDFEGNPLKVDSETLMIVAKK